MHSSGRQFAPRQYTPSSQADRNRVNTAQRDYLRRTFQAAPYWGYISASQNRLYRSRMRRERARALARYNAARATQADRASSKRDAAVPDEDGEDPSDDEIRKQSRMRHAQTVRERKQRRRDAAKQRAQEAAEKAPAEDGADQGDGGERPKQRPRLRTWKDDTGKFSVVARFVELAGDKVRLKKVNGRAISVALERLSKVDQDRVLELVKSAEATDI